VLGNDGHLMPPLMRYVLINWKLPKTKDTFYVYRKHLKMVAGIGNENLALVIWNVSGKYVNYFL
jgi:hypothetical protein